MNVQELSHHREMQRLTRLTQELRQSCTPRQTLDAFHRGFAEEDELLASLLLSTGGLGPDQYRVVRMQLPDDPQGNGFDLESQEPGARPQRRRGPGDRRTAHGRNSSRTSTGRATRSSGDVARIRVGHRGSVFRRSAAAELGAPAEKDARSGSPSSDLVNALERVALGGALMENQMLAADLARANEQIDREARQVGELAARVAPASVPQIAGLEIATSYEPTGRAGGDSYDFFPLDHDRADATAAPARWCMLIGDASGHGLAAAVVMAIVQAVLHAHPAGVAGPATLLMHANRQLCDKQLGGFFTAFLGVYEPASRRLTYANAGHPPPLLKRASDGSIRALDARRELSAWESTTPRSSRRPP